MHSQPMPLSPTPSPNPAQPHELAEVRLIPIDTMDDLIAEGHFQGDLEVDLLSPYVLVLFYAIDAIAIL